LDQSAEHCFDPGCVGGVGVWFDVLPASSNALIDLTIVRLQDCLSPGSTVLR
jgi:hypothetical protein